MATEGGRSGSFSILNHQDQSVCLLLSTHPCPFHTSNSATWLLPPSPRRRSVTPPHKKGLLGLTPFTSMTHLSCISSRLAQGSVTALLDTPCTPCPFSLKLQRVFSLSFLLSKSATPFAGPDAKQKCGVPPLKIIEKF